MLYNLLTKAELSIMDGLHEKKLYKEMAYEKKISINTVKKHVKSIYRKLEVGNRAAACRKFSE